jgi:tRNA A37 methylthiotransferase MiaB
MADAAVENPLNTVPPHKKQLPSSIPNFDTLEGFTTEGDDDYSNFKKLQRQLEYAVHSASLYSYRWLTVAGTSTSRKSTSRMSSEA